MVFPRSLSGSKSPLVSKTLLSILDVLTNAVIWIVSIRPPTSKYHRSSNSPLVTVPRALFPISTIVSLMIIMIIAIIIIIIILRVFNKSVRWWFFTGVWVTADPFKSPGSSQDFVRSQQCCSLHGLLWPSNFEVFSDSTECANYNCCHHHFHVP